MNTALIQAVDAAFTALQNGWSAPAGTSDKALRIAKAERHLALVRSAVFTAKQFGKVAAPGFALDHHCTVETATDILDNLVDSGDLTATDGHFHRFYSAVGE